MTFSFLGGWTLRTTVRWHDLFGPKALFNRHPTRRLNVRRILKSNQAPLPDKWEVISIRQVRSTQINGSAETKRADPDPKKTAWASGRILTTAHENPQLSPWVQWHFIHIHSVCIADAFRRYQCECTVHSRPRTAIVQTRPLDHDPALDGNGPPAALPNHRFAGQPTPCRLLEFRLFLWCIDDWFFH